MPATRPSFSIIVPAYRARDLLPDCLAALLHQTTREPFEIIVVVSGESGTAAALQKDFPGVRWIESASRLTAGQARNRGAAAAQGAILAFLDADCRVKDDWLEQLAAAHRGNDYPLIGGAFENNPADSYSGWAYYFCSLSHWLPHRNTHLRPVPDLPSGQLSIKRWAYTQCGPFPDIPIAEDTLLCWRVARAGYPLFLAPQVRARHGFGTMRLGDLLRRRFRYGTAFAALRMQQEQWPMLRRWHYLLATPVLPLVLVARCMARVWAAGMYRRRLLLTLPAVLLGMIAWSLGEARAYVGVRQS